MSYEDLASAIDDALAFMEACGIDLSRLGSLDVAEVFSSHEALVLVYEEALVRGLYDCSGHFLWIGERTRGLLDAHIEFFRHLVGPVGVKLGPTTTPEEVKQYCQILNRKNIPGRLTFISRMGADNVRSVLPGLMKAAREIGCPVVWICDPMHGNTFMAGGFKTRDVRVIKSEIAGFFAAAADAGEWPGGLHLELTGDPVTECIGGHEEVTASDLPLRYTTACDPRLNALQGIEIAFFTARLLRQLRRAHSRR
jgi:3-deoxy-7-phosphoheptulonate synthase